MRLGILGGAFNPPHLGHLLLAQEAHARLGLDRVLLVPVGVPPHRRLDGDPGGEVRERLVELAIEGDGRLDVTGLEVERAGPSYTVETLETLHRSEPAEQLTLILGADQALRLADWNEPERVLELARVAVAERVGVTGADVVEALVGLPGAEAIESFDMPRLDVSSSLVRERVAAGLPIRYLVPERVAEHVEHHGLYAGSAAAGPA